MGSNKFESVNKNSTTSIIIIQRETYYMVRDIYKTINQEVSKEESINGFNKVNWNTKKKGMD